MNNHSLLQAWHQSLVSQIKFIEALSGEMAERAKLMAKVADLEEQLAKAKTPARKTKSAEK